jgi:hypothetical protein
MKTKMAEKCKFPLKLDYVFPVWSWHVAFLNGWMFRVVTKYSPKLSMWRHAPEIPFGRLPSHSTWKIMADHIVFDPFSAIAARKSDQNRCSWRKSGWSPKFSSKLQYSMFRNATLRCTVDTKRRGNSGLHMFGFISSTVKKQRTVDIIVMRPLHRSKMMRWRESFLTLLIWNQWTKFD